MVVRFFWVIRVPVCPRVSRVNVNTTDATTGATALLLPVCVACVSRGEDVSTPAPVLDPLPSAEDRPIGIGLCPCDCDCDEVYASSSV